MLKLSNTKNVYYQLTVAEADQWQGKGIEDDEALTNYHFLL